MMREHQWSVVAVSAVMAVVAFSNDSPAAPILDQAHIGAHDASVAVSTLVSRAQTFTVEIAGILSSVELSLFRNDVSDLPLLLEIRDATGSLPSTTVLASAAMPISTLPISAGELTPVDVSAFNIEVAPGNLFALVLTTTHAHALSPDWAGTLGSAGYTGGEMHLLEGGIWVPQAQSGAGIGPGFDGHFRTFVEPTAVPEPAALYLLSAAVTGFTVARRRAAPSRGGGSFDRRDLAGV
jgi:hypothetical protein